MEKNGIGKQLRERRVELSLTQRQVADYVGVTEATVSRWESGEIDNMRRDKIAKLAQVLQVSPLLVMGLSEIVKNDNLATNFSSNLRNLIAEKGITQKELAEYMQVSAATISSWLTGLKLPRMGKLDKLCVYFNVDRSALLERQVSKTESKQAQLNPDETNIVNGYRALSVPNKQLLNSLLLTFLDAQNAQTSAFNNGVIQNNRNGDNFYNSGNTTYSLG